MATTAGDIYVRSGASGSFTEITYVQGGWVTVASSSTMYSLYHDRLKSGQIVYVQSQNQLYVTSKFVAFQTPGYAGLNNSASFATFQFPSSGSASVPSGTISSSTQIADLGYLTSASAVAAGFGSGGGGSTDISALNTFTGSAQTSLTALNSATSSYLTSANTGSFILVSQTSSMSVLSALTASFIGNLNYNFITNLPNLISSSAQIALLGAGLLSSSAQIANQISGSFTSLSASFAARLDSLNVGGGIFQLTGSSYNTTNNIQITGSLSVGSGSFKSFEVNSDGFVVLGDMNKDLNTAPIGTVVYSGSNFYLIS
jgi:hypothetical protein